MSETSAEGTGAPPARRFRLPWWTWGGLLERLKAFAAHVWGASVADDGEVSKYARGIDNALGFIEQVILFALLSAVVLTAAGAALSDKLLHDPLGRWWFTVVRDGTFTIAMMGAVFATHQQRHLAMDLVSRQIPPKARLALAIVLRLFTILVAYLLFKSGMHQREHVGGTVKQFIDDKTVVTMMPIGAALIALHCFLHIIIDFSYLDRGKTPAEKARTGH